MESLERQHKPVSAVTDCRAGQKATAQFMAACSTHKYRLALVSFGAAAPPNLAVRYKKDPLDELKAGQLTP